ncbi:MAG: hypothetical protein A3D99_01010 [Candidatus Andersenbacteria bacterium RIFCSPHIGHO2_12_FULL_45_11]|uniref:Zinc-ribbon domain-containing protein n=1 Tax=Candidatus Andersenbacteria bacterium RIFCSPHIGHO2_12_FULL_45_11 TaxID=1797281 RepID=A0A1G1X5D0_9BACT|nr:MAG: hypothetical protein A3D99_01010 [Candidatus Andersenbacteria bacterium RIFCSPHIGHO2_12_FULL_45_11]
MALIKCPECKKEISDKAGACPSCGYSVKAITVEQTSKKYKNEQIVGAVLIVVGMVMIISREYWGAIPCFIGLVVIIHAKSGAWYNNG